MLCLRQPAPAVSDSYVQPPLIIVREAAKVLAVGRNDLRSGSCIAGGSSKAIQGALELQQASLRPGASC